MFGEFTDQQFLSPSILSLQCQAFNNVLLYTAKLSRGKTFAVVHKIHYSLENFCGASGRGHHVLYTASDSRGKLWQSAEKLQKL